MKKFRLTSWILIVMFVLAAVFAACTSEEPKEPGGKDPDPVPPTPTQCGSICATCGLCTDATCTQAGHEQKCQGHTPTPPTPVAREKHLIVDEVGDYGGTYNRSKFGEGTPLNGALDVENDTYYTVWDYYTMYSTETRTLMRGFAPYQQTMANSDGIACALMILNNEGKDIVETYNEVELVKKYETLTKQTVYKNSTTPEGLVKLFKDCGMTANSNGKIPAQAEFASWFKGLAESGKYAMVRWQNGLYARWMLIVGYETMGTDSTADDVIIFADPFDAADHWQDGYYIYHFNRFFHWWKDMGSEDRDGVKVARSGDPVATQELIVINGTVPFDLTKTNDDPVHNYPEVAPMTRLLNKDGTIGGSYGDGRYTGAKQGSTGYPANERQATEHVEYGYYTFPDYTHMPDGTTRLICTGYRAFRQTMSSSCGICSTMSVLEYYGFDWSTVGNYIKRTDFVGYDPVTNPKFGGVDPDDNGRKQEAIVMIYEQGDSYFADGTKVFYDYGGVGSGNLMKVPTALGYPTDYDRYYRNNFDASKMPFRTYESFLTFAKGHLAKDEPIVISWNPTGGHWEVIIGLDDMGTATPWDDVIILGDSSDGVDHYNDGFNMLPATLFFGTWYNGSGSTNQQYVAFTRKAK